MPSTFEDLLSEARVSYEACDTALYADNELTEAQKQTIGEAADAALRSALNKAGENEFLKKDAYVMAERLIRNERDAVLARRSGGWFGGFGESAESGDEGIRTADPFPRHLEIRKAIARAVADYLGGCLGADVQRLLAEELADRTRSVRFPGDPDPWASGTPF